MKRNLLLFFSALAIAAGAKVSVTLKEGTNIAAALSPDKKTIVMDFQGSLWRLPVTGGVARRITDPLFEATRPAWSPKGDLIAFQAYKGGGFHIWTMKPDGSDLKQRTEGHGDDREPSVSPDGTKIAFASDRAFQGSYDIWVLDLATGKPDRRTSGEADEYEPAWSPDGTTIAFVSGAGANGRTIEAIDSGGKRTTLATAAAGGHVNSPSFSPDGKRVAYVEFASNQSRLMIAGAQAAPGDDVFPFPAGWFSSSKLVYAGNGELHIADVEKHVTSDIPFTAEVTLDRATYQRRKLNLGSTAAEPVKGIVSPALSPDGRRIVFEALNQIWLMDIGGKPRKLTDDAFYKEDPAWSPDGKYIAYSSDKAGTEDLYIYDVAKKSEKRLTSQVDSAEVSAAWSPDGKQVAYQDQTGATWIADVDSEKTRKLVNALFAPSKPSWSANGHTIAIGALKAYTQRYREGTSQILTADVATGNIAFYEPAPFKTLSTRGEDGPIYSPDGSSVAFVMDSVLWIRPVDANGIPAGPARQINHEATDAPTWSGDSKQLLYLSNGKLRMIGVDGSSLRDVPLDLTWRNNIATQRTIIHAGRLWDGNGPEEKSDVDITVANGRIESIAPHRAKAASTGVSVVDASNLTVMPGLWESHTHEWISGKFYGDRLGRLWMAYGVTELQSMGDPVYRAAETREAFASGDRVGPRYFASGEAIDGERVYYNFMRATLTDAQLDLEMGRAKALDYDILKTYVRLPHEMQEKAVKYAHEKMGVNVISHYMLPGMAYGMDGMSHVSATARLGFPYTRSAAGVSYSDMRDLFVASGMFVISTPFSSTPLYAEDPGMVEDKRLLALNTPWDQQVLRGKLTSAQGRSSGGRGANPAVTLDSLKKEEETLKALLDRGGAVLIGTDSPLDSVATALHLGIRAEVKYGIEPWRALQTATYLPAKTFGVLSDLGTVEPGKLADLAFVAGDPLQDIKNVTDVRFVMKNGRLYSTDELMKPFMQH